MKDPDMKALIGMLAALFIPACSTDPVGSPLPPAAARFGLCTESVPNACPGSAVMVHCPQVTFPLGFVFGR